jgi:hypothetical protein
MWPPKSESTSTPNPIAVPNHIRGWSKAARAGGAGLNVVASIEGEKSMEVSGLINWTFQKAQSWKAEPGDHARGPSIEWLLSIIEPEPAVSTTLEADRNDSNAILRNDLIADAKLIARPPREIAATPENMPGMPSAPPQRSIATPEAADDQSQSELLRAILAPDIHTPPQTRDRAIALRWVLRDIKSDRVKLSAVSPEHLRALTELNLVEARDDAVVLTTAGASAVL